MLDQTVAEVEIFTAEQCTTAVRTKIGVSGKGTRTQALRRLAVAGTKQTDNDSRQKIFKLHERP